MDSKPMLILVLLLVGFVAGVVVYGTHKPVIRAAHSAVSVPISPAHSRAEASKASTVPAAMKASSPVPTPVTVAPVPETSSAEQANATQLAPVVLERKPLIPGPDETDGEPVPMPEATKK
jgi:hypothetical protein